MTSQEHKDLVFAELDRILGSATFATSSRSANLLRFLVTETLAGHADQLKEYALGVGALGRKQNFDPRVDPIARVEASRLRSKLDLYYAKDGSSGGVRIVLPRGTYVPEFEIQNIPAPVVKQRWSHSTLLALCCLSVCAFLSGVGLTRLWSSKDSRQAAFYASILPLKSSVIDSFALSPDGLYLAIAASMQGVSRLYLRPLSSSFEERVLPATENASYPFWSPDGRSIAFFAERKLKVIDITGGEPRVVADAPLGRGGAWSKGGDIVFAPGALGSLLRVSSQGGKPLEWTKLDGAQGEVSHLWPTLLPDGNRFAYLALNRDPALSAIVVTNFANSKEQVHLLRASTSAALGRSGPNTLRLLFLRDGQLTAQELSAQDLRLAGEPVTVAKQVDFEPLTRYGLFSISQKDALAFMPGTPYRYQLTWFDRNGGEHGSVGDPSDFYALKLSPDGSHLLVNQTDARTGHTGVSNVDLTRGTVSPVTLGSVDFFPIWSPDGAAVAFARSDGTAERGMRLSMVSANGGSPRVLSAVNGPVFPSDWSDDGKYIAYTGYAPLAGIRVLSLAGNQVSNVWSYSPSGHSTGGAVFSPSLPNKGPAWIAYTSDESGRNEVYVGSFPDVERAKLQISVSGGSSPSWRRDGKELYFIDAEENLMAVEITDRHGTHFGEPHQLFRMPLSLLTAPPYGLNYAASKDGQRFLMRHIDSKTEPRAIAMITHWRGN